LKEFNERSVLRGSLLRTRGLIESVGVWVEMGLPGSLLVGDCRADAGGDGDGETVSDGVTKAGGSGVG
jgi:hypothetical protein